MAVFGPKLWVNPFAKKSIVRLFELLVFMAQKGVFSFQNIVKEIVLAYIPQKKNKVEKLPILDQNHGLTPLDKCQFFGFGTSVFYSLERRVFLLEYRKKKKMTWPLFPKKKKVGKTAMFEPNYGLTPQKKCQFFDFLNFLFFIAQKVVFSFQNLVKDIFLADIA